MSFTMQYSKSNVQVSHLFCQISNDTRITEAPLYINYSLGVLDIVFQNTISQAQQDIVIDIINNGPQYADPNDPPCQIEPENDDEIQDPSDLLSSTLFQIVFSDQSTSQNGKWLSHYGDGGMASNETLGVIPWKSKLVAYTFSNKTDDTTMHFKIYKSYAGDTDDHANKTLVTTLTLDGARLAYDNNLPEGVIFETGDKLGVYSEQIPSPITQPPKTSSRTVIILYFKILDTTEMSGIQKTSTGY